MNWSASAIVLSCRRHGEHSAILHVLTREHGRHAGLVRGAYSKASRGVFQPGNVVEVNWRARLEDHLGQFSGELADACAARAMDDPLALDGLAALCALVDATLPEREAHPLLFDASRELVAAAGEAAWPSYYVRWELALLAELGFGLELDRCAVTGSAQDLAYVSPRSGRAVGREAAAPYRDRLLALPPFLAAQGEGAAADVVQGLALSGYFLAQRVFTPQGRALPAARQRFVDRLAGLALSGVPNKESR